jgi:adenylate cyclase
MPSIESAWRSPTLAVFGAGGFVLLVVLILRAAGLLQGAELAVYDQYLRRSSLRLEGKQSSSVVLLEITEDDIRAQGHWPISDRTLADAMGVLLDAGARVVGLDIYRDLPVAPGQEIFERLLAEEPRIVGVRKFGDLGSEGIPGPPALEGSGRVGFNDLLVDRDDRVRRGLLFQDDGEGDVEFAFALRIALIALAAEGVAALPAPENPDWLQLGPTSLRPFEGNDGGYSREDAAGYQFLLDYAGSAGSFDRFTLSDLLEGRVEAQRVRDKIVVIGSNAQSLPDFFPVPVGERLAGLEVHANLVDQLLRFGRGHSVPLQVLEAWQEAFLIFVLAALGCAFALAMRGSPLLGTSLLVAAVLAGVAALWLLGLAALRAGLWVPVVAPALAWTSAVGLLIAWVSSRERAQRDELMRIFSRHVSAEVADEIWRHREDFFKAGRPRPLRLDATVMFVDMRGYTKQSEKMDPELLLDWSNEFMDCMAGEVVRHGGVVDDYFGDGIKANFGVPIARLTREEVALDALHAVRCSIAMAHALEQLNVRLRERDLPTIQMKIGLDTGAAVAGSVGSADRLKYTVVGGVVVNAQRLESTTAVPHDFDRFPCRILVSGRTRELVAVEFELEAVGEVELKGKAERIAAYRVPGVPGGS